MKKFNNKIIKFLNLKLCIYDSEMLEFKQLNSGKLIALISVLAMLPLMILWLSIPTVSHSVKYKSVKPDIIDSIIYVLDTTTVNKAILKQYIIELNFKFPDIIYAQAILESSKSGIPFSSDVFKRHNNLFGMKKPTRRISLTCPNTHTIYAHFNSWKESVIDRALFDCRFMSGFDRNEYLNYLGRVYAEDPQYVKKIIQIAKTFYI